MPGQAPEAELRAASPGFFAAMGIPVVRGRAFPASGGGSPAPEVVINEALARRHWPGEDPVGRRIVVQGVARTVVGVVGDVAEFSLARAPEPTLYFAHAQARPRFRTLLLSSFALLALLLSAVGVYGLTANRVAALRPSAGRWRSAGTGSSGRTGS